MSTYYVSSITVSRHFGLRTLRTQDISALVPKCPYGHFGTSAKMSWGHFGTKEDTWALRYTGWQGGRMPSVIRWIRLIQQHDRLISSHRMLANVCYKSHKSREVRFWTRPEMSWVRSVLGPKCLDTSITKTIFCLVGCITAGQLTGL